MKDIKLDFINHKMLNDTVDEQDRISQQIKVAVRSYKGDFFLNDDFGVDYDNSWGNIGLMKIFLKEQIEAINGVVSVASIDIIQDKQNKNKPFIINATVILDRGSINIFEEISQ